MTEGDGVDETLIGLSRTTLTMAAQAGEVLARTREQRSREAAARSEQAANETAARVEAEHQTARAYLAVTRRDEWWSTATPAEVTYAYETARAWSDVDADVRADLDRIIEQIRSRHGVDLGQVDTAEHRREALETIQVMAAADRIDRSAEVYDTPERRERWAADLADTATKEVVQARVVADVAQAKPAAEAVEHRHGGTPRARKAKDTGNQISRTDRSR